MNNSENNTIATERLEPDTKKKSITDKEGFHNFWKATHCSFGFFLVSVAAGSVSSV
jgi:hypothetical protein